MSKQLYRTIDDKLSKVSSICQKGCSACCYQQIEVLTFEKDTVQEGILKLDSESKKLVTHDLISWLDFFDKNTPNERALTGIEVFDIFNKIAAKHSLKCPFLQNNECTIYELRPATCRIHYVTSDVELCTKDRLRESGSEGMKLRGKVMDGLKKKAKLKLLSLPYVAAEILLPDRQLKNIVKNEIH